MKSRLIPILPALVVLGLTLALTISASQARILNPQEGVSTQTALGTAFTYQGQLKSSSELVNGVCDFQFSLWDASSGGLQVGGTQIKSNVLVSDGYFTIPDLDFGSNVFTGDARWLEIGVRCPAGGGSYTTLSPRQALTAAPYALALPGLWTQQNSVSPNVIGGYRGNSVTDGGVGATIGGGGASGYINRVTDNYGTVGGGGGNTAGGNATVGGGSSNTASGGESTIGGGWLNTASGGFATVGGGYTNTAGNYYATVSGGSSNTASHDYTTIGGGRNNTASGESATVGGGWGNTASGESATVGGGVGNTASGESATVGSGGWNVAAAAYATIAGGGPSDPNDPTNTNNRVTGDYGVIGGGGGNTASGPASTVSGGWGNTASGESATVGGGDYNVAAAAYATIAGGGPSDPNDPGNTNNRVTDEYGTIGGGGGNRAGDGDGDPTKSRGNTVGGGFNNIAMGGVATVGGGYNNIAGLGYAAGGGQTVGGGMSNTASNFSATVSGGRYNTASGIAAAVGGGEFNDASSHYATVGGGMYNDASGEYATVGGGYDNSASGAKSTVGGGWGNSASGAESTVGGGDDNSASGFYATVPGGSDNVAQGDYSFAAGRRAKAYNRGCFVLADATDADEPCVNDNRFVFRVTNAFYIWTTADHTAGVLLPTGGNAWSSVSDRAVKENFASVDGREILDRLASIPIQTWNYKSQEPAIRHIGPVAQDFYAAFGVGEDDTHISTVDADGVALAAIQGLYRLVQEKDDRIAQLEKENLALRERMNDLEARMEALEQDENASGGRKPLSQGLPGAALYLLCSGLIYVRFRYYGKNKTGR